MAIHVMKYENADGDLIDIGYYCSAYCFTVQTGQVAHGHAWPAPSWPDYTVVCDGCEQVLHEHREV